MHAKKKALESTNYLFDVAIKKIRFSFLGYNNHIKYTIILISLNI